MSRADTSDASIPSYADLVETHGADAFFELANAPKFTYENLVLAQDADARDTCGGIVWESAFCLAKYLRERSVGLVRSSKRGKKALEVGCGCGLLGLVLARDFGFDEVVMTDQSRVLENVTRANVEMNRTKVLAMTKLRVMALDWELEEELSPVRERGPYDVVVGTDVLFSVHLVAPLLRVIERTLNDRRKSAVCYICVQRRSPDAHDEFLRLASEKFDVVAVEKALVAFSEDDECEIFELRWRRAKKRKIIG
jgi:predicted nicotinamide N-methyase